MEEGKAAVGKVTDPVEVFQRREARKKAEAELAAHKWTLKEIDGLDPLERRAFDPYIAASHARGDFRYLHELGREEFAEAMGGGFALSVYDVEELTAGLNYGHGTNSAYIDAVHEFVRAAHVMCGPDGRDDSRHFIDDTGENRLERISGWRIALQNVADVRTAVADAVSAIAQVGGSQHADVPKEMIVPALRAQQEKVAAVLRKVPEPFRRFTKDSNGEQFEATLREYELLS